MHFGGGVGGDVVDGDDEGAKVLVFGTALTGTESRGEGAGANIGNVWYREISRPKVGEAQEMWIVSWERRKKGLDVPRIRRGCWHFANGEGVRRWAEQG